MYKKLKTFNHSCYKNTLLPDDVHYIAYIPTFRNNQKGDFGGKNVYWFKY